MSDIKELLRESLALTSKALDRHDEHLLTLSGMIGKLNDEVQALALEVIALKLKVERDR